MNPDNHKDTADNPAENSQPVVQPTPQPVIQTANSQPAPELSTQSTAQPVIEPATQPIVTSEPVIVAPAASPAVVNIPQTAENSAHQSTPAVAPQPTPQQVNSPTEKKKSKTVLILIFAAVIAALAIGLSAIALLSNSSDEDSSSSQTAISNDAAVAKTEALVTLLKNLDPFKPSAEFIAFTKELDTYAKYIDEPNLSKQERLSEATQIGGSIGVYSRVFSGGTIERKSIENVENNNQYVLVTYRGENPTSTAFSGPYDFLIYTAYIDGEWRIVNFEVI